MKKINKNKTSKKIDLTKVIIATIIIVVIVISLESIIFINLNKVKDQFYYSPTTTTKDEYYDVSSLSYLAITLSENNTDLTNTCSSGCVLKIKEYNKDYYYIINYTNKVYYLLVVSNNKIIVNNKSLGESLDTLYMRMYKNYITLYNINTVGSFTYDYVIFLNENNISDEISSLEAHELSFEDYGVIYYYDECSSNDKTNANKVKAYRLPYSTDVEIISLERKTYSWCINKS